MTEFVHQPPTIPAVAPPPEPPPTPVTNTQAHAAPGARPIAAAAALLRDAATKFERHIANVDATGYTAEGLHRQIKAFAESPAAQQIDDAVAIASQREADAEARVAEIIEGLKPKGDVAEELRSTRAWARAQRKLDAAPEDRVGEVARALIADADPSELGVLIEEIPSYLEAKRQGTDWVETVVAEKVPELAAARRTLNLARKARPVIEYDAKRLRGRITDTPAPKAYEAVPFIDVSKYDPDR